MKIIVHFWVSALVLIACNSNPKEPSTVAMSTSSSKYRRNRWKGAVNTKLILYKKQVYLLDLVRMSKLRRMAIVSDRGFQVIKY